MPLNARCLGDVQSINLLLYGSSKAGLYSQIIKSIIHTVNCSRNNK